MAFAKFATESAPLASGNNYKHKFNSDEKAKRYSTRHLTSKKGARERSCIKKALSDVKKNALVLDLPCGTGRLSSYLADLGFNIVGADYSTFMLHYAKQSAANLMKKITFEQQDITAIKHADNTFSAAVCNRLFHHYPTAELRRSALRELARVTDGPIVVSFFNSYSLSAFLTKIKNSLRHKKPQDRFSIPLSDLKKDIEAVGLTITDCYYTFFGISPQMYVKLRKI